MATRLGKRRRLDETAVHLRDGSNSCGKAQGNSVKSHPWSAATHASRMPHACLTRAWHSTRTRAEFD